MLKISFLHKSFLGFCFSTDNPTIGGTLKAYGSENRVVLLSSHLVVLHVLEVGTEPVLALDWHDRTSRLAVSCGNHVIVYRAVPRGLGVHDHVEYLNLEKQLDTEQPFVPRALSWDPTPLGRFLAVGGSGLLIWDTLAAPIEKEPVPPTLAGQPQAPQVMTMQLAATQQDPEMGMRSGREINLVSFSPDGTLLATLGKDDRAVKVWYYNSVIGYTFVYLPHPRAVTELEWRQPHVCRPTVPNVLLTRTVDGAVLLWEETPASQRFQFTLKLTLTSDTNIASARWLFSPAQYLTDILYVI
jgi:WD40 repeat protein